MLEYPKRIRLAAPALLLALGTVAGGAFAADPGRIHGKVTGLDKLIPDVYAEAADAKNHRYNWREASPTVPLQHRALYGNPSREVVIGVFTNSNQNPFEPIKVKVTGGRTNPSMLVVPPNTRLSFTNVDPFPHKLYQVNDPKFAPNVTGVGSARDWTAGSQGRYEIRDEFFPSLRTYIVVEPQVVAQANPSRSGEFSIDKLPPGDFTLRAYFNGKPVGKDTPSFHIPDKGGSVDLKSDWNIAPAGDAK
jgi:hypothetical protein